METNNIELLEAYMQGTLTPVQQAEVEQRLNSDASFKIDYEMYNLMVSAITETRKTELKSYISKNVAVKSAPFFRTPTFYAAAAASVVLCLVSYFVIVKKLNEQPTVAQTETKNSKVEGIIDSTALDAKGLASNDNQAQNTKDVKEKPKPSNSQQVAVTEKASSDSQLENRVSADNVSMVDDVAANPDDVKVESDKMQLDTFLFVARKIYIAKPKQYQTGSNDLYTVITTGDKLKLEVQFWKSPINYSGYKFNKNLVVVYGNFDASLASFQELKDILYLKYKNSYFKLVQNQAYTGMKEENDPKIIADLELK